MQMEFEGYIQQQPAYSHVGYAAAVLEAVAVDVRHGGPRPGEVLAGQSLIGASLVCLVVAAVCWRRLAGRGTWRWVAVGGSLLAGSALMVAGLHFRHLPPRIGDLTAEFVTTLYRLEELSAATDAFADEWGRHPTTDEWYALFPNGETLDGWGKPLRYVPGCPEWAMEDHAVIASGLPHEDVMAQPYVIASMASLRGGYPAQNVLSWQLGRDGVFGTQDDSELFKRVFEMTRTNANRLPHGRTPRKG